MPNLEEHCKHCLELFKVEGREIHKWLDAPSRIYGGAHRVINHGLETAILVGKMFGKNYGEGVEGEIQAKAICIAHIILDTETSKKKGIEAHPFTQEQLQELEEEKPRFQQELTKIQKQIKELDKLPPLTIREMIEYRDGEFAHKSPALYNLVDVSLRYWQKHIFSRDKPNREISKVDIGSFIAYLNRKVNSNRKEISPSTKSDYLGQLVPYFKRAYGNSLGDELAKKKRDYDKEKTKLKKKVLPLRRKDVKLLYNKSKLDLQIAIRLLLIEEIPIRKLSEIYVNKLDDQKNCQFLIPDDNGVKQERKIDSDTIDLVKTLMDYSQKGKYKNKTGKLFKWNKSHRGIDDLLFRGSEKLHIEPKIKAKKLVKFGRNMHPDDLKEFLSDASNPKS